MNHNQAKMKKIAAVLMVLSLMIQACASDEQPEQQQNQIDTVQENDTPVGAGEEQETELPEPGSGTITSDTETPLKKQNQAEYKAANGKTIIAVYYFDSKNQGVVVLQQEGIDDITLHQKIDDMPSNSATYTNGTIVWSSGVQNATYDDGKQAIEYQLIKAKQ